MIGDTITLRNQVGLRLQTTKTGLKELKKVEQQIKQNVMPDFGYQQDNYLLEQHTARNKWSLMTDYLGDSDRFSQLMNFIKLNKIESEIREVEAIHSSEKHRRSLKQQQTRAAIVEPPPQHTKQTHKKSSFGMFDDLLQLQKDSRTTLNRFKGMASSHSKAKRVSESKRQFTAPSDTDLNATSKKSINFCEEDAEKTLIKVMI